MLMRRRCARKYLPRKPSSMNKYSHAVAEAVALVMPLSIVSIHLTRKQIYVPRVIAEMKDEKGKMLKQRYLSWADLAVLMLPATFSRED